MLNFAPVYFSVDFAQDGLPPVPHAEELLVDSELIWTEFCITALNLVLVPVTDN